MKPSSKAVMIGCISFFVFLYGNLLFGGLVGSLIPSGDDLILKKINLLLDKMEEK